MTEVWTTRPPEWEALSRDGPLFGRPAWLEAFAGRIEGEPVWALHREAGRAVLGLFGTVISDPDAYAMVNLRRLVERSAYEPGRAVRGGSDPQGWVPNLALTFPGYELFPVGPGAASTAAVRRLLAGLVDWASDSGLRAVGALYVSPGQGPFELALAGTGFERFTIASRADLELAGSSFGDYLAGLSAHRRRRVLAERRRVRARGVRVRRRALADHVDEVAGLRLRHRARYGHPADLDAERLRLRRLAELLPELLTLFLAEAAGDVVSATLMVRDGATWHALLTGTNHDDERWPLAYFETTYYAPIEAAHPEGIRRISFGHGADRAKLLRGCRVAPVHGWVRAVALARGGRPPLPEPPLWSGMLEEPSAHPFGPPSNVGEPGKTDPHTRAEPMFTAAPGPPEQADGR